MSSGMNRTQAEEYAKTMTYKQAIGNIWKGKGIKYRKATMIKLHELAEIADRLLLCKNCKHRYMDGEVTHYYWCRLHDRPVDDTDYCAWGEERKEE